MPRARISRYVLLLPLIVATPAFARVLMSEVMWMGSDLSTADEWVEMICVEGCPRSLSGWTLTSLGSDGTEKTVAHFGDIFVGADQYVVVSNYPAATSRLAVEPILTTTAMTLPNTKLLLRIRDGSGNIVDEVDDGIGVPFAGMNPSGTGAKASMERVSLFGAGTVKENWQTATLTSGFDPGVPVFGTPGSPRTSSVSSHSASFLSPSSHSASSGPMAGSSTGPSAVTSVSSHSASSGPSAESSVSYSFSSSISSVTSVSSVASVASSCVPNASNIHIAIQSGEPRGEGKVTLNLQLLWEGGLDLRCVWDYGDGFTSTSCNPPSHTFAVPGRYEVQVEAEDTCGGKTALALPVDVLAKASGGGGQQQASSSSVSSASCTPQTFAGVEIVRFLPNPRVGDSVGEWVELRNISDRTASLCGWSLDDAEGGSTPFPLSAVTLAKQEIRRFPASLTKIGLNNDQDHVRLFAPGSGGNAILLQDAPYAHARQGVVMDAWVLRGGAGGRVVRVIDGDTVVVELDHREATVRLLGIDAPEVERKGGEGRWGQEATEFLLGLLEGGIVTLDVDIERQDVYSRVLAYLSIGGHDVQAELLRAGLARVYERCTCVRKGEYVRLEEEARRNKVGMWSDGKEAKEAPAFAKAMAGKKDGNDEKEKSVPSPSGGGLGRGGQKIPLGLQVILSEVYPVPLPAEGEWVEMWNGGVEPVDLSGWALDDTEEGGSRAWEFPGGFILPPGAFIVLRSDQTHLAWNNEGDVVVLIAPDGTIVDRMRYGKLRRGHAFARIIQRIGSTGAFRATDRFCITDHPTPFERNICRGEVVPFEATRLCHGEGFCEEKSSRTITGGIARSNASTTASPKVRRVVHRARRVRYRNVLPEGVGSGALATPDPLFASLLAHMERSVQSGQVVWREEDLPSGEPHTTEWEVVLLPFLLVLGAHCLLTGIRRNVTL